MTDRLQTAPPNGAGATSTPRRRANGSSRSTRSSRHDGPERARQLLTRAIERAQHGGTGPIASLNTPYVNTIPAEHEAQLPGDPALERRLRSIVRWNAMAMVIRANKESSELGGHIASYQSLATLYEVGFNHFWHAPSADHGGDLVYFQGHSSPGNYARAFLEGRLTEAQLDGFRQEVSSPRRALLLPAPVADAGFLAVPHRLARHRGDHLDLPGPVHAVPDRARDRRYHRAQGVGLPRRRRDGRAGVHGRRSALAGREQLDNLIWVVNCNLQRLDGPVRGNGKIIQELESDFRGAGWNVIKVIWGSRWDPLLAADSDGRLLHVMDDCVDGDYQTFKSRDGAYVREHFFGRDPVLAERVAKMSDDEIWLLNRGGHDQQKVYAAYHEAVRHEGQPTVILAKTIKGYGMGASGEGQMITHQAKKMTEEALLAFRDRFELPLTDEQVRAAEYYKPPDDSPEMRYLRECRAALGGSLPARRRRADPLPVPPLETFKGQLEDTGEREISTTMAFVRVLAALLRDKEIGRRIVPIVPDESRTFGMEGLFRQVGIYSPFGQRYQPQDSEQLMFYREDEHGQILEEGITEAGSISSFIAAGTSLQRPRRADRSVLHLLLDVRLPAGWRPRVGGGRQPHARLPARRHRRAHDAQRRGPPARGRPQSRAVQRRAQLPRLRPGLRLRGGGDRPGGPAPDVRRAGGRLLLPHADERELPPPGDAGGGAGRDPARACTGCASAGDRGRESSSSGRARSCARCSRRRRAAGREFGVARRRLERHLLHRAPARRAGDRALERAAPARAAAAGLRERAARGRSHGRRHRLHPGVPDQIRQWVPGSYRSLGTDGFGRSDYRRALRGFFEVDRRYVALAALRELAASGELDAQVVADAIVRFEIDPEAPMPVHV